VEPRLQKQYKAKIVPALLQKLGLTNVHQVPKIQKVVINMGLGEAVANPKAIEHAARDLALITGQKPLVTKAKKSIASYKVRENAPIGLKVTLRGVRMYEFLDRLISAVLPRIRDFQGVSDSAFDKKGNFSIGITDYMVFPELIYDDVDKSRPLQVIIVTSAQNQEQGKQLIQALGFPLRKLEKGKTI